MDSKWLLTSSGHPVLQPGEVECFTLSSVELESHTNPTIRSGLLILTTHRLLWIPDASTSTFYASGIPLKSVSRIFSINMPIESIIENPKVRFQVFTSPEGKVEEQRSSSAAMITFFLTVLTGKSDPDAFLVKFWEIWSGRTWEKSPQEGPSGSKSDGGINFVDSGVGAATEASGGDSHDIPQPEDVEICLWDKHLCTKCNKGGRLFACSDVSCPLAFHEECMPQTLSIIRMDNFYCFYCSYKRAFLSALRARKALLLAKKNLLLFFGEIQKAPKGASHPIILGETACDETAKLMNEDGPIVHSGQLENDQEVERATQVDENQEVGKLFDAKPDDAGRQIERDIQVDEQQEEAEEPNIPTQLESSAESSRKRKCDDKRTEMQEHDPEPLTRLRKRKLTSSNVINTMEKNIIADTFKKRQNLSAAAGVEKRCVEYKDQTPTSSKIRTRSVEQKEKTPTIGITRSRSVEQKEKTPTMVKTRSRTVAHEEEVEDLSESSLRESSLNVEHEEEVEVEDSSESSLNVEHEEEVEVEDSSESSLRESSLNVEHEEEVEVEDSSESLSRESSLNVEHEEEVEEKTTKTTSNESNPHHFSSPQKKRKKCLWRVEEEEILKEGVEKFSTKIKKNIPWKKLLEFGSHVFDNSRNARDLKDKWKNLQAKEQPPSR